MPAWYCLLRVTSSFIHYHSRIAVFLLACAQTAWAQAGRAELFGTVRDPAGLRCPAACGVRRAGSPLAMPAWYCLLRVTSSFIQYHSRIAVFLLACAQRAGARRKTAIRE